MDDERNTVAPDDSMPTTLSGQGVTNGSSTPNADMQAKLSQLEQRLVNAESRAEAAEREAKAASRRADKVREQVYGRLAKKMESQEEALRAVAGEEGWDESTLNTKIAAARTKVLISMNSKDLTALDADETPTPPPPQFPATQVANLQYQNAPQSAPQGQAQNQPLLDAQSMTQHYNDLRAHLNSLGLSEKDVFGEQGLIPYLGKPNGSKEAIDFAKKIGKALEAKEELAAKIGTHLQREANAQELAEEVEQYGNLGGTDTGGGGNPANNLKHQEKKILEKYRGTGRIAEAQQEINALRARLGG